MKTNSSLIRKSHFLGTKIRNLRKGAGLTMEDLSARCIKIDPEQAPSVSYLSMIERGKRVPSNDMLEVIAEVFQKEVSWFLDDAPAAEEITPDKANRGGIAGMALEPSFLFANEILQIALPEMLAQTGTSGRQFAQLLIRAHQEYHRNSFPDLERAAEEVGRKRMPLSVDDLIDLTKKQGMEIQWFDAIPQEIADEMGVRSQTLVRSYIESNHRICLNKALESQPERLKYDLAVHLGNRALHGSSSVRSVLLTGRSQSLKLDQGELGIANSSEVAPLDILQAWRDFECSFFAGALLAPKVPFRQLLDRVAYSIDVHKIIGVTPAVAMRRMTAVSSYPHWHYFDAYAPGTLKAVYRGNGIPLPWGNMRMVKDACQHWAVFRKLSEPGPSASAQISVMETKTGPRMYACESHRVDDLASNPHVLCAGIDLNPALTNQGQDANEIASALREACVSGGGTAMVPTSIRTDIVRVAKILNISWVEEGLANEARVICARGAVCPRSPQCYT
jgi:transcriptional regulator with XRE-family HTH domain